MSDRFVVTSGTTGDEVATANTIEGAQALLRTLGGEIIDRQARAEQAVS